MFQSVPGPLYIGPVPEIHIQRCQIKTATDDIVDTLENLEARLPDAKKHSGSFEPAEDTKRVPLEPNDPDGKALTIGASLDSK